MTTINSAIAHLQDLKASVEAGREHTDKEAGIILEAFDEAVVDFTARMAAIRSSIVNSYKGQMDADRVLVEGAGAKPMLQAAE